MASRHVKVARLEIEGRTVVDNSDELFEDRIRRLRGKPPKCTGAAARWCPNHGDCTCATEEADQGLRLKGIRDDCPLHGEGSDHYAASTTPVPKGRVAEAIHATMEYFGVRTDQYAIQIVPVLPGYAVAHVSIQEQVMAKVQVDKLKESIDVARPAGVDVELKIEWV